MPVERSPELFCKLPINLADLVARDGQDLTFGQLTVETWPSHDDLAPLIQPGDRRKHKCVGQWTADASLVASRQDVAPHVDDRDGVDVEVIDKLIQLGPHSNGAPVRV